MKDWILPVTAILVPVLTLIAGYFAGQRGRSNAIATTVEKDWLNTIAEDLAEFIEVQIDIVWKRWRIKLIEDTTPETSSHSYEKEGFRAVQEAAWRQTFRSDLLKSKLLLMLDDRDPLQQKLIAEIDAYAKHVPDLAACVEKLKHHAPPELLAVVDGFDRLLRERKPQILDAGRRVLAAKREAIRKSI
jgi:hypothetical protein